MKQSNWTRSIVVLASLLLAAQICSASDDDLQYWTTGGVSFDLNQDWKLSFEEEFRFARDATLFYNHSDVGIVYRGFADCLDVGISYRQVFAKDSADEWKRENRPHFNATLKGKLLDLDLSNRLRLEYRDHESRKDAWRLRNKFTVKFPVQMTELEIQPYLADEIFVDLDDVEFNIN